MTSALRARRLPPRVLTILAVLLIGLVAAVAPGRPASAGTGEVICFWFNGHKYCIEIPYAIDPHYLLCPHCPGLEFGFEDDPVLPERIKTVIVQEIADSMSMMFQAGVATDPAVQARYQE